MSNLVFNAGLFSWIGDWFYGLWINLWLLIDNVVYIFINWIYRVFILIAKVDIFSGGDEIAEITRRLYLIVGIAMLFIFAYNLILLIVNPDGKQLGNMGKVVQNALISIILVTLLPLIFSTLTTIQNHIIDSNVIGHIILGSSSNDDPLKTNKQAGVETALTIFSAFYHPKGETVYSCQNGGGHSLCPTYVNAYKDAQNNSDISSFIWNDDLKKAAKKGEVEYNWIISTIAGGFAVWMFISFALDIGVRVGKLAFYEIISPIPVMMRILPGDKMFDKWYKGISSTFISLFVRLAVVFFCMYAITLVPNVLEGMWANSGDGVIILALANVAVILGILMFAKEAPKLIGDLFGGGGKLDFSIGKKYKEAAAPLGRIADMGRSGIYSKLYGGADGQGGSFLAGAWRGRKGYKEGVEVTDAKRDALNKGSTFSGRMQDRFRNAFGMKSRADEADFRSDMDIERQKNENELRINNINRKRQEANIDTREANNSEVLEYRSNIKSKIEKEAAKTSSKFTYNNSLSDESYIDQYGKKQNLSGKSFSEIQTLFNNAQAAGVSSDELSKIQKYMDTRFYTDSSGNKVELKGDYQNLVEAREAVVEGIPAVEGRSDYTVEELEQLKIKAEAHGADPSYISKIENAIQSTKVIDKAIDEITYVDKSGTRHEISGNLSELEQLYESALANGESAEVLSKLSKIKGDAKSRIEKEILEAVLDGSAESKGIKSDVVADINMNRDFIINMQSEGRVIKKIDSNGNEVDIEFNSGDAKEDAKAILSTLEAEVSRDKRDIQKFTNALERERKEIERLEKELERQKKERQSSLRYRSMRADSDAIKKNEKKK